MSDSDSSPSVDVSSWNNLSTPTSTSDITLKLDQPIDLTGHILSPFYAREFNYQDCRFSSVAHLMCYRYAVLHGLKTFATAVRKWARPLTEFPTSRFQTVGWNSQCRSVLREIYSHLCLTDIAVKTALLESGPRPYVITAGPEFGSLRSFFRAAVRALVRAYIDYPHPGSRGRNTSFSCSPIRPNLNDTPVSTGRDSPVDQPEGIPGYVDASPTHLYFIYSYCSSRPDP